jgi:hypothetical protein
LNRNKRRIAGRAFQPRFLESYLISQTQFSSGPSHIQGDPLSLLIANPIQKVVKSQIVKIRL